MEQEPTDLLRSSGDLFDGAGAGPRTGTLTQSQKPAAALRTGSGKSLLLGVTNQPPQLLQLIKPEPTPLKKRDTSRRERKIQVLLGRDLIGFAEISGSSRDALPTTRTNAPNRLTNVFLTFDPPEQAAKAAEALRLADAIPKPLEKSPTNGK
jgi:hypothetical protein